MRHLVHRRPRAAGLATLAGLAAIGVAALAGVGCATSKPSGGAGAAAPGAAAASPAATAPAVPGQAGAAPDRALVPVPGAPPGLKLPPQKHFALANGLKVRLVEYRRLPIVALHLVVDAGAVHDPPDRPGLAGFTAAMMTEGTRSRSALQLSDELGFLGASLAAGAGFDSASLSGSALTTHLEALLAIFADVLANPTFPAADFARVQDARLVALVQQRDVPGAVAAKAFGKLRWGEHPYGHWLGGTEASVKATTREDLARFHSARWRPGASELVVVGDVSEDRLRGMLEKALAGWTGAAPPPRPAPAPPATTARTVLLEKKGAPQAYALLGMPGFPRSSPDYVAGEVALQVLGGGTSSRLFRELREKEGYTYGVFSRGEARKLGGTSVIAGNIRAEVTGPALRSLLGQVQALRDAAVPEAELAVTRNSLLLSLPSEFAVVAGIAGKLAEEVVHGLPDDYWTRYAAELRRVSPADVQRAAAAYLDPARLTTVLVCDTAAVRPQLEGLPLGPIEVRQASAAP